MLHRSGWAELFKLCEYTCHVYNLPKIVSFSTLLCLPLLSLKVLVAFCIAHFLFLYNIHIYT